MLTEEELRRIGVNPENIYPGGEMNVIVQCIKSDDEDSEIPQTTVMPDIYHPRKNRVYSCQVSGDRMHDLTDEDTKTE